MDRLGIAPDRLCYRHAVDAAAKVRTDSPYVREHPAKKKVQDAVLVGRGWPLGRPIFWGKTPHKPAAEPRDCPCQPRAPQRVRVGLGLGSSWSGPTCKVEIDHTPAQTFLQGAPAHRGSRKEGICCGQEGFACRGESEPESSRYTKSKHSNTSGIRVCVDKSFRVYSLGGFFIGRMGVGKVMEGFA